VYSLSNKYLGIDEEGGNVMRHKLFVGAAFLLLVVAVLFVGITSRAVAAPQDEVKVVLMPHGDDEAISAAGVMSYLSRRGYHVRVVFAFDSGNIEQWRSVNPTYTADRQAGIKKILEETLGITDVVFLSSKDGENIPLKTKTANITNDLVNSGVLMDANEIFVIAPTGHNDHIATYNAAMGLFKWRPSGGKKGAFYLPASRLVACWGYDKNAKMLKSPKWGKNVTKSYWRAEGANAKARLCQGYVNWFFANNYPTRIPSALWKAPKYKDVYSVVAYKKGRTLVLPKK
jgi:LmbE family N-acetylglucosaminyl deacetylase